MNEPKPWIEIGREPLQHCKVFDVSRSLTRSPRDGRIHGFYRIDSADWVNVIPMTPAGEIVMVRQFRHGLRRNTLEIPGGIIDPGEEPADAAVRELREESGYRAGPTRLLGHTNPNPALFGNRVYSYLSEACVLEGDIQNSPTEETRLELVPQDEIPERMQAGEIDHALVIAAFHWWQISKTGERG
jgi:8-oxo-dGTP pyrophosphatase MutT (NUDIX family)